MAHYALLDENNIVTTVITGVDENVTQTDLDGTIVGGSTEAWEAFYGNFHNQTCKRTSYNTYAGLHKFESEPFRKNYAGVGYFYDEDLDAFIPPKDFPSWVLNEETCLWQAPISRPTPPESYRWDESLGAWVLRDEE